MVCQKKGYLISVDKFMITNFQGQVEHRLPVCNFNIQVSKNLYDPICQVLKQASHIKPDLWVADWCPQLLMSPSLRCREEFKICLSMNSM